MTANIELIKGLARTTPSRIVLLVIDGLGGLPHPKTGKSELETARTPNLDRLTRRSVCGLSYAVGPGITPGSAPGHLAIFGYDPVKYQIGRGVLEAVGIDFDVQAGDVAARGNFATVDGKGNVTDRRAGRITTEKCAELCRMLDGQTIDDVRVLVRPVREHRFVAVFRGEGLRAEVTDSDPQQTGVAPKEVVAVGPGTEKLSRIANGFITGAKKLLAEQHPANMVLLRGFSQHPELPGMADIYRLKPAVIALYPMYRGLARLVGMTPLVAGTTMEDEFQALRQHYADYDFFFVHLKGTDSAGEDGDFDRKVQIIEEIDGQLPRLIDLKPEVIVITGDHSTPAVLRGHSWHPVPVLLYGEHCRPDAVPRLTEAACLSGGLGNISATQIMPLALANALKLAKFGA